MGGARLELSSLDVVRGRAGVLHGVSLAVAPGEVVVVIGPNGSGKSSLVMAAAALLPLAAGRATIDGRDVSGLEPAARARLLAYVPQRSELSAPLLVREVVAMGRYAFDEGGALGRPSPAAAAAIASALAAVDATSLADRRFTELSGGEAQRVVLARALATGADVLLLDEPSSALDVAHRLALARVLRGLAAAGKAVLIALHDLTEAATLADRVVLLHQGRVLRTGSPSDVLAPGPVREAYGVELVPGGGFGYRSLTR